MLALLLLLPADSSRFRGADGTGVVAGASFPAEWGKGKNLAWTADIPGGGWSAPVVAKGKVFLTLADSGGKGDRPRDFAGGVADPRSFLPIPLKGPDRLFKFDVLCLDRATGKPLWRKTVAEVKPKHGVHPSNSYATETPATDGERVYALFASAGVLAAFSLDGEKLWEKELGAFRTSAGFGPGSSLAVGEGLVFVQHDNEEKSFVAAFDGKTGKEAWRAPRKSKTAWATPLLWDRSLVVCGSGDVKGYDPKTGKERWTFAAGATFTSSPTADKERLYFGASSPGSPSPLWAIKAGGKGTLSEEWSRKGTGPGMPSPVVHDGLLYTAGSVLNCHDAATGEVVYKQRLPKAKTLVASLFVADGRLYLHDEAGTTFVIKPGRKFELLGTNKVDDTFWSTPTADGDSLLLRGLGKLYCVRKKP